MECADVTAAFYLAGSGRGNREEPMRGPVPDQIPEDREKPYSAVEMEKLRAACKDNP